MLEILLQGMNGRRRYRTIFYLHGPLKHPAKHHQSRQNNTATSTSNNKGGLRRILAHIGRGAVFLSRSHIGQPMGAVFIGVLCNAWTAAAAAADSIWIIGVVPRWVSQAYGRQTPGVLFCVFAERERQATERSFHLCEIHRSVVPIRRKTTPTDQAFAGLTASSIVSARLISAYTTPVSKLPATIASKYRSAWFIALGITSTNRPP